MRVIGIDPGLRRTGWGVVDVAAGGIAHVANGVCLSEGADLAERLCSLHVQLTAVLARHRPEAAAVELLVDRGDGAGYGLLAFDATPDYLDTHALPVPAAKWSYKAIFRVGGARVGQWSDEVSIMVGN